MLIATQSTSVAGTQQYFDRVLTQGDYYLGQEVAGHWRGRGAELLGLGYGAAVTKEHFDALLRGEHPLSGERLTQRVREDRRPGVDLTYSVPKSVSLAWAVGGDERIPELLREAVIETMERDVEPLVQRRVRQGRYAATQQKTHTGKLVYADFLHKTARPVQGAPDPHLHVHAFVMNWTEEGGRHYAAELEEIVRQRPSLQAKFEARLARKLQEHGYRVEQVRYQQSGRLKTGWELQGVARETIEKFSRRTAQVEQYALEHGVRDAAEKGKLGKYTRERKDEGRSIAELRQEWRSRLTVAEQFAFAGLRGAPVHETHIEQRAADSVRYALDHCLHRASTAERHQVVGTALEHALTLTPEAIEEQLDRMQVIERRLEVEGAQRRMITTRPVLEAERRMIAYARDGRGTRAAICEEEHVFQRDWLNDHQKAAVHHVLQSRDAVTAIVGGAGTGKTSLMQEAVAAIEARGKQVHTFAPSTGAREVLQEKGFQNAQTVEHLVRNTRLHGELKDQVIWIDEAGLVDVRSMNAVFDIARRQNAKVVLSGDTRQHAAPSRGEAMRLLETEAGLRAARVEKIQRQQGRYQEAVALISRGHEVVNHATGQTGLVAGFDLLDRLGKVHEIAAGERHAKLAETYLAQREAGKSPLVVAPTHAEGQAVTAEIRQRLQAEGVVATDERKLTQLKSLNLTTAQKGQAATYRGEEGVVVQFHQNAPGGFQKGDRYRVTQACADGVRVESLAGGAPRDLPLAAAERFEVYAQREIGVAVGDKLRFNLGGVTRDGASRLSNGRLDEVRSFDRDGNPVLANGWVVDRDYGHLDLGYVITSHASQGKDRKVVIAAMGAESLPAVNAKQFYVTVSRGSEDVVLFVDDKQRVRRAIERSGQQLSASELVRSGAPAGSGHEACREGVRGAFQARARAWLRTAACQVGERLAPTIDSFRGLGAPQAGGRGLAEPGRGIA